MLPEVQQAGGEANGLSAGSSPFTAATLHSRSLAAQAPWPALA